MTKTKSLGIAHLPRQPVCSFVLVGFFMLPMFAAGDDGSAASNGIAIADPDARVPLHTVVPKYPEKARELRLEGEVEVCFEVTRAGKPRRIAVRRSTHRWFERPSIRAVKASTYAPVAADVALSGIKTCRTFRFDLDPVPARTDAN